MSYRLHLDVEPVPAPRPRFGRFGTYYPARYNKFKAAAARVVKAKCAELGILKPLDSPLIVMLNVVCEQPKKTKLDYPRPDVDNYAKSFLDACNGLVWADDTQIVGLGVIKRWAAPGMSGYAELVITDQQKQRARFIDLGKLLGCP